MTGKCPVTQRVVGLLLTHKEHAVEMVESIIKETDLNPCAGQTTKDLGTSGLFDLSRVCFLFLDYVTALFLHSFTDSCFDLKRWCV